MKLVTYNYNDTVQVGLIGTDPAKVVPASVLGYRAGDMTALIRELGGEVPASLLSKVDAAAGVPFADCRLLAPIKHPEQDVLCLGVNYLEHRDETVKSDVVYDASGTNTIYFGKRVDAAVDPFGEIDSHSDLVDSLDYEVELAVIIGKDAKHVPLADAKEYVFGYTILS